MHHYSSFFDRDIVLENDRVRIEPLQHKHFELLTPVAMHAELWAFTAASIKTVEDFRRYFDGALEERAQKTAYPFSIYDKQTNKYAGCTRFGNVSLPNRRVEIGWTWYDPSAQRTGLNRNCKLMLLSYAFELLELNRVELKTSNLNLRSQKAMEQIGAVKEGILRSHMINEDGTLRDTVYYSFIKEEWPQTKARVFSGYDFPVFK